jgi:NIPSNAP protein
VTAPRCYELRRYTLHPGGRAVLTELFEQHFSAGQRDDGIDVVGPFHDLDDPSQFVWLRSFPDMARRRESLAAFYGGPVWRAHRERANATMIDSDNVLLLQPETGIDLCDASRLQVTVWPSTSRELVALILEAIPHLEAAGCAVGGVLSTLHAVNDFPALPVRAEDTVVLICRFGSDEAAEQFAARLASSPSWQALAAKAEALADGPPATLRLRAAGG